MQNCMYGWIDGWMDGWQEKFNSPVRAKDKPPQITDPGEWLYLDVSPVNNSDSDGWVNCWMDGWMEICMHG